MPLPLQGLTEPRCFTHFQMQRLQSRVSELRVWQRSRIRQQSFLPNLAASAPLQVFVSLMMHLRFYGLEYAKHRDRTRHFQVQLSPSCN